MMRSMYAGVSGLKVHQTKMDVVGNNISNVNTTGFKGSRATFKSMMSQLMSASKAPQEGRGGVNPQQVGLGVSVGSIDTNMQQGNLQSTGMGTDLAIQGNGFFVANDGQQDYYTRAGALSLDENGNLTNSSNGYVMKGWMADDSGNINTNEAMEGIQIPVGQSMPGEQTTEASFGGNLDGRVLGGDSKKATIDVFDSLGEKHTMAVDFERQLDGAPEGEIVENGNELLGNMVVKKTNGVTTITESDTSSPTLGKYSFEITDTFEDGETIEIEDGNGNSETFTYSSAPSTPISYDVFTGNNIEDQVTSLMNSITDSSSTLEYSDAGTSGSTIKLKETSATGTRLKINNTPEITQGEEGWEEKVEEYNGLEIEFAEENSDLLKAEYDANNNRVTVSGDFSSNSFADVQNAISSALGMAQVTLDDDPEGDGGFNVSDLANADNLSLESEANTWDWSLSDVTGAEATSIEGNGTITFNEDGTFDSPDGNTVNFDPIGSASMDEIELDFENLTQSAADYSVDGTKADGFAMGSLETFTINSAGIINGTFSNGLTQKLGQLGIANFSNPSGLKREGDTLFQESQNSGMAQIGTAGNGGRGEISAGTLEMSNVDLSKQFTEMITTQRGFQANSKTITTTDQMLQELVNLKR